MARTKSGHSPANGKPTSSPPVKIACTSGGASLHLLLRPRPHPWRSSRPFAGTCDAFLITTTGHYYSADRPLRHSPAACTRLLCPLTLRIPVSIHCTHLRVTTDSPLISHSPFSSLPSAYPHMRSTNRRTRRPARRPHRLDPSRTVRASPKLCTNESDYD